MYSTHSTNRTQASATFEKRTTDKQPRFIQRFYLFGTNPNPGTPRSCSAPTSPTSPDPPSSLKLPKNPKLAPDSEDDLPFQSLSPQHYSVQRLKQFWNNRLSLSSPNASQTSEAALSAKLKRVTLSPINTSRKPVTPEFLRRNGSTRGSASRRNVVRSSLVPLYSKTGSPKATRHSDPANESSTQKRSSVVLSPVKDLKKEKRSCLERVGCNAGFPLVTASATGGRINWARRVELLGIRMNQDDTNMPIKVENYVNNFIEVDIQNEPPSSPPPDIPAEESPKEESPEPTTSPETKESTPPNSDTRDSLESKKSLSSTDSQSLGRRHGTPTRKVSFRTTTSPYNRKLLQAKENKVMALTNKFNKMCQQDAGILEEVRKRGGFVHKSGSHVYKVVDGEGSVRKKLNVSNVTRTDESSDDVSVGSKGSYRKAGVKKRPSLRKNLYRKPEWEAVNRTSLCVKEALEIFEPNGHRALVRPQMDRKPPAGRSKPKVPDKSDQVIRKTRELKNKRAIQIDSNSCDSSEMREVAIDKVPNSISQDSINEERSEVDSNTQVVEEVAKVEVVIEAPLEACGPERVVDEYSVVKKMSDINQNDNAKLKKDKKDADQKTLPKQKSTVQRIYEKFTFRSAKKIHLSSPERTSSESQLNSSLDNDDRLHFVVDNKLTRKSFVSSIEIPTIHIEESQESSTDPSDRKIVDAIKSLNVKIDNLSRSFNDLTISEPEPEPTAEPAVQPNTSFLFRSMSKIGTGTETTISQLNIVQAVNTVVINKSISMDDHHFPCRANLERLSLNETIPVVMVSKAISASENDYELVSRVESPRRSSEGSTCSFRGSTMSIDIMGLNANIDSFLYKAKNVESATTSDLPTVQSPIQPDTASINSYESFENYESIERTSSPKEEDTYEVCNPPEPLPPRNDTKSPNDLALPQPKRNLAGSPKFLPKMQPTYESKYEKVKYDQTPPRPPKPEEVPLPPRNSVPMELTSIHREAPTSTSPTPSEEPIYEENIYDTIKSSDGLDYDEPNGSAESAVLKRPKHNLPADAVSLMSSSCYESIGSKLTGIDFLRHGAITLPRMGSISTLASDQITNSLYGCNTNGGPSLTPPSERGSDTSNSAEWTDISDDEEEDEVGNGRK
ncbi:uncharacterized protein LOC110680369 [Aedes aegypti]|uniref:Uncharacterized protein n=1 Tax=Aedes aegypti TaxID=7159 RepID=A0A903VMB0_AEDAE|nr:uncharacterized protein LOC110680369 [Aedes aegypti]